MWLTGLVAPRHVGSSQTRARTRVPCIGRQILNHCATREALSKGLEGKNHTMLDFPGRPVVKTLASTAGGVALPKNKQTNKYHTMLRLDVASDVR